MASSRSRRLESPSVDRYRAFGSDFTLSISEKVYLVLFGFLEAVTP